MLAFGMRGIGSSLICYVVACTFWSRKPLCGAQCQVSWLEMERHGHLWHYTKHKKKLRAVARRPALLYPFDFRFSFNTWQQKTINCKEHLQFANKRMMSMLLIERTSQKHVDSQLLNPPFVQPHAYISHTLLTSNPLARSNGAIVWPTTTCMCKENGLIKPLFCDFGDWVTTQLMGLMSLSSELL